MNAASAAVVSARNVAATYVAAVAVFALVLGVVLVLTVAVVARLRRAPMAWRPALIGFPLFAGGLLLVLMALHAAGSYRAIEDAGVAFALLLVAAAIGVVAYALLRARDERPPGGEP